jgi:hypothetical protein
MTIVVGHHLALNEIVEFTLMVNSPASFVAGEEIVDMNPYLVSSGTAKMETHIYEILRNCRVEPVLRGPGQIVGMSSITLDVRKEAESTKHHLKGSTPLGIVVGLHV